MLSIGLAYDGDWKASSKIAGNGIKTMCDTSQKHIKFLEVVRDMLSALVNPSLAALMNKTLRVTIMRGARTLGHTNSFRGNTPNFLFVPQPASGVEPGWLAYETFPKFKSSVVQLDGHLFTPHMVLRSQ